MVNTIFVTLVESGQNWPISPKLEHFWGEEFVIPNHHQDAFWSRFAQTSDCFEFGKAIILIG